MRKILIVLWAVLLGLPSFAQNLTPKKVGKLWGFVDDRDSIVIEPKYTAIGTFKGYYTWVNIGGKGNQKNPMGGLWGVVDRSGKEVCPVKYNYVDLCDGEVVAVNMGGRQKKNTIVGGKWGYVNLATGKECVPVKYDQVGPFNYGNVTWVYNGSGITKKIFTYSELNEKGKSENCRRFDMPSNIKLKDCFVELPKSEAWALIDKSGTELSPFSFISVRDFKNGYAVVYNNDGCGLIDSLGHLTIPCIYKHMLDCYPEKVVWAWEVLDNWNWNYNWKVVLCSAVTGQVLTKTRYRDGTEVSEGVAWAFDGDKYALIDVTGKEVIKPTYLEAFPFRKGVSCVWLKNSNGLRMGYVDTKGNVIVKVEYNKVPFRFGDKSPFQYQGDRVVTWAEKRIKKDYLYEEEYDWIDLSGKIILTTPEKTFSITDTIPNELWDY
jgi:hypothetical protein